jgi:DNA-directed RNA polymerase specialized sigma24 family protein
MIVSFQKDHLELVQQAMNGRTEALHQLAETVCKPLKSYVLRITFKEEITDDIVQETLLEMYKIFAQLKNAELFWPWLCKIALNKVRQYSLIQKRHHELLKITRTRLDLNPQT